MRCIELVEMRCIEPVEIQFNPGASGTHRWV
jgi:hypothetical protein